MKRAKKTHLKRAILGGALLFTLASYFFSYSEYIEGVGDFASTAKKPAPYKGPKTNPQNVVGECSNCRLNFTEPGKIAYDDDLNCAIDRMYLQPAIEKMNYDFPWVTAERKPFPEAAFPRECAVFVMKFANSGAQLYSTPAFTNCIDVKEIRDPDKNVWNPRTKKIETKPGKLTGMDYMDQRAWGRPNQGADYDEIKEAREQGIKLKTTGRKMPCVTKQYANSVYNAFVDVSDCFNLHQKDLLAKLMNESGLHINIYGPNHDTGLGQLTGEAIRAGFEPYYQSGGPRTTVREYLLKQAQESNKASCRRILNFPQAIDKIDSQTANRCSLMMPSENPYRNMFYTAIFYRTLLNQIAGIRYVAGKDKVETPAGLEEVVPDKNFVPGGVIKKFEMREHLKALFELQIRQEKTKEIEAGLTKKKIEKAKWKSIIAKELPKEMAKVTVPEPDMHGLTRALVILAYNAGPTEAAGLFNVYLKKRLELKRGLKPSDINFLDTAFRSKKISAMGNKTFLEVYRLAKEKQDPAAIAYIEKARATSFTKSLPEFLMLNQTAGTPAYLTIVAQKHKELIQYMGNKLCVSDNFITF